MSEPSSWKSPLVELAPELFERLVVPLLLIAGIFGLGTAGYFILGQGRWGLLDCAYMVSITLTTVGYGEVLDSMGPQARTFTMVLMWLGMGVTLYAVSTVTAFVVEHNLTRIFRERKMEKQIAALEGHVIVCGAGQTGFHVVRELVTTNHPCLVVELDQARVDWLSGQFKDLLIIAGDATEEATLRRAGVSRAKGLVAVLAQDSQNMLITVEARFINPNLKIVTRCNSNNLVGKFTYAGANYVINPAFIGGMRMASELIRPHVVTFLDRMLRGQDPSIRVDEVQVAEGSPLAGKSLAEADVFGRTGLTPIALQPPDQKEFTYNPGPETRISPGAVLLVIGNPEQVGRLEKLCRG